jgi:hypothetical protein
MMQGCKVFILKDANPKTIPARNFRGAVNLDTVDQTCNVTFYAGQNQTGAVVAIAHALAAGAGTPHLQLPDGIHLQEGVLSFIADTAPTGNGIAIYYDEDVLRSIR